MVVFPMAGVVVRFATDDGTIRAALAREPPPPAMKRVTNEASAAPKTTAATATVQTETTAARFEWSSLGGPVSPFGSAHAAP